MTLLDVAKMAGVSSSTVSRVINSCDCKSASPETKQRIWKAVQELGYVPNSTAKELRVGHKSVSSQPSTIHLLFARSQDAMFDSYFSKLRFYIQQKIILSNCKAGIQLALDDVKKNNTCFNSQDGLIVLGKPSIDLRSFLKQFGHRVVFITLNQMEVPYDHVISNGTKAAQLALDYLYSNQHRSIAYVGECSTEVRFRAYMDFVNTHDVSFSHHQIINVNMSIKGGQQAVKQFLMIQPRPTAVFCANDATAIGFIKELQAHKVSVPNDVSVISIDNIPESENVTPLLTTVSIPLEDMANFAVMTVIDRINKHHKSPVSIFIPPTLFIRDSTSIASKESHRY